MSAFALMQALLDKLFGGISPAQTKSIFGGGWILFLFFVFEELAELSGPEKLGYSILTIASAVLLVLAARDLLDGYLRKQEEERQRPSEEFKALADEIRFAGASHRDARALKQKMSPAAFYGSQVYADDLSTKEVLHAKLYELGIGAPSVSPTDCQDADGKAKHDYDLQWIHFLNALHPLAVRGDIETAQKFTSRLYPPSRTESLRSYFQEDK